MIPYGRQTIGPEDIAAVVEVLESDWLTQGPAVDRFESAVAGFCRAQEAVAVSSGTAALHLACIALDVGPGKCVWTVPNTFVASANCARHCGAEIGFVDIDLRTGNMNIASLECELKSAGQRGCLPDILVPVHFSGLPCDMEKIGALAQRFGFRVIEDSTHALGAWYGSRPVGSCEFSDMSVFSFHPVKIATTGEGGVITTNDPALARRLRRLRSHGITRDVEEMQQNPEGAWYYELAEIGFNYRITDMQAALGASQMQRVSQFVARRTELAERYDDLLRALPVDRPYHDLDSRSAWHLYVVRLQKTCPPRREVFERMRASGIGVNVHYIPVHTQPYYQDLGFSCGDYPAAEEHYRTALTLPLFPSMSEHQQDHVVNILKDVLFESL